MKRVNIAVVKGSEGYSLQVYDEKGNGYRYIGPKAWENPRNIPTAEFNVDVEDFISCLNSNAYEVGDTNVKD